MMEVRQSESFARLLAALEPWPDQVVIVGGWAHQLYRLHPHSQHLHYPPLATLDTDIAVPARLPVRKKDIRARLLTHGFAEEFLGEDRPPATHYRLGGESSGFYAEFLTPLIGSEIDRRKKRRATAEVAGVVSQRLRYIEILLQRPWSVKFATDRFGAVVQIANPVCFLAQKILIHGKRSRGDKAKDILYVHDTLEVFGACLPELRDLWRNIVSSQMNARGSRIVSMAHSALFSTISDDVRRAAEISAERALNPEAIREACHYGLRQVFG